MEENQSEWLPVSAKQYARGDCEAMPAVIADQDAEFVIVCQICGKPALLVDFTEDAIAVRSPIRRFVCRARTAAAVQSLRDHFRAGRFNKAHQTLLVPCDGLDYFCPECDAFYCSEHYRTWANFEEGSWYDDTVGECPRGHRRIMDD